MRRPARKLRYLVRRVLHTADSPQRTAAAFALGVFLGLSPFFGLHTLLALGLAFLLRLNRPAVVLGTLVLNPWTIVPLYGAGTGLGLWLLGRSDDGLGGLALRVDPVRPTGVVELLAGLGPSLAPFIVGNLLLGAILGGASYPLGLLLVRRFRRLRDVRRARRRAAAMAAAAEHPSAGPTAPRGGSAHVPGS